MVVIPFNLLESFQCSCFDEIRNLGQFLLLRLRSVRRRWRQKTARIDFFGIQYLQCLFYRRVLCPCWNCRNCDSENNNFDFQSLFSFQSEVRLPGDLESELNFARGRAGCREQPCSSVDVSRGVEDVRAWRRGEIRSIQDVEELRSKLNAEAILCDRRAKVFEQAEIQAHQIRSGKNVAAGVAHQIEALRTCSEFSVAFRQKRHAGCWNRETFGLDKVPGLTWVCQRRTSRTGKTVGIVRDACAKRVAVRTEGRGERFASAGVENPA